jgi:uncharacterized protein YidB (DUF937 family)
VGLFGNIINQALGSSAGSPQNPLLQLATGVLLQHGGLEGLKQKFETQNLGHLISSWIGTGQNQPVTGDQVTQVLGTEKVQELAQQAGVNGTEAADGLAKLLPELVDRLTPGGNVPSGSALEQGIASLLRGA